MPISVAVGEAEDESGAKSVDVSSWLCITPVDTVLSKEEFIGLFVVV